MDVKRKRYDYKHKWEKQTYGWYAIPFMAHVPRNNVDKSVEDKCPLRYCSECELVYESIWMGGKYKYYKLYLYPHFPKSQKVLVCPKCKGKKVKEAIES